ncbi:MAG: hypothetical protein KAH22_10270 [Thiotrichaceae bacterium]|nr:hypothetical protein [Thiotrichaceae bacterium]
MDILICLVLISSSFSGLKENIIDGKNGFIAPPGDIDKTAEIMEKVLMMKSYELEKFSNRAREHAMSNFDIKKQIDAHSKLYQALKI